MMVIFAVLFLLVAYGFVIGWICEAAWNTRFLFEDDENLIEDGEWEEVEDERQQ